MTIVDGAAVAHEADRLSETGLIPRGSSGPTRLRLRRFRPHRAGMVGLAILLFIIAIAVFAPLIAPHDPNAQSALINEGPSSEHWLGTDDVGRDLLSRGIYGARRPLVIPPVTVALAVALALPLALLAGYRGGWVDSVISRFTDAMFAFPPLVLALAIVSLRGRSTINLIVAIGLVFVPS